MNLIMLVASRSLLRNHALGLTTKESYLLDMQRPGASDHIARYAACQLQQLQCINTQKLWISALNLSSR